MGIIRVLDEALASQIAAGEVVERPGSIAKELIENALDARATRVDVHVEGGGVTRLVVRDDGVGMVPEDAVLAFSRHATSKLAHIDDLKRIGTFGFRGEALAAIASVARVTLTTRPRDRDAGYRVRVDGGHIVETTACGAPFGTEIVVEDVFFNVPARRKFLKAERTESAHVEGAVLDAALARPDVAFACTGDGRRALDLPVAGTALDDARRIERVVRCLGPAVRDLLFPIALDGGDVAITGYVVAPLETRRDTSGVRLSVNGRPVSDRGLVSSVRVAFRTLLEVGRQPMCALDLALDPGLVDVNVHPRKAEVRFVEPRRVHGALIGGLSDFLSTTPWLKRAPMKTYALARGEGVLRFAASGGASTSTSGDTTVVVGDADDAGAPRDRRARIEDALRRFEARMADRPGASRRFGGSPSDHERRVVAAPGFGAAGAFSALRVVGQVALTYLVLEGPDGMVVIDQHAAHERVVFERLRARARAQEGRAQPLLFPARVGLTAHEHALLAEHQETLRRIGLDVEPFSDVDAIVRAVPVELAQASVDALVRDTLSALDETGHAASLDAHHDALCARMACHASVRRGQSLAEPEIRALLASLDDIDLGAHCPHGRPVVRRVGLDELARWFDRE